MDPINPIAGNPEVLNQIPTPQLPKIKNPLVLIMSILLIVTVAIAALFYFQIQKLSKELTKYQTQPSPTPTATTDETADWKTYLNPENNFSFKYPPELSIYNNKKGLVEIRKPEHLLIQINSIKTNETDLLKWWGSQKIESYSQNPITCFDARIVSKIYYTKTISSIEDYNKPDELVIDFHKDVLQIDINFNEKNPTSCWNVDNQPRLILIPDKGSILKITFPDGGTKESNQILSTFKFLE